MAGHPAPTSQFQPTSSPAKASIHLSQALASSSAPWSTALVCKLGGKDAWLKISQVRVLSTQRLGLKLGKATPEQLAQAIEGLHEIVGD